MQIHTQKCQKCKYIQNKLVELKYKPWIESISYLDIIIGALKIMQSHKHSSSVN